MDDQIAELMVLFMKRKLVKKTERKYKKPKPGKKRLVKFPRTLVPHPVRSGWGGGVKVEARLLVARVARASPSGSLGPGPPSCLW